MKLSISLTTNKAAKPVGEARSLKRPAAFALAEDEEPVDAAFTSSADLKAGANKKHLAQNVKYSKARLKQMEAERRVDATVFEYDEVWDKMQEAKLRQKEAKEADSKERKVSLTWSHVLSGGLMRLNLQPKYIAGLLNSAATRKLDYLRAEEKMIQREREMEGDEFAGKESFVTQAYKDQLAEIRRAEEEERLRNGVLIPKRTRLIYLTSICPQKWRRERKGVHRRGWRTSIGNYWTNQSNSIQKPLWQLKNPRSDLAST
jgi:coiled-coil domain-containing protein 55